MQIQHISTKVVVALLLFSAAIATLVPYAWARINTGDEWRGVTPELSYDAMFYYSRANDVTRGHFFVTNPYFFEHRDERVPTPSQNDVIIALPQILGFSFNFGYYANIFLWALALLSLLYALFRSHTLSPPLAFSGAIWCYVGVYGDMLRPGTMQIIFPLHILFLWLFWRYLNHREGSVLPLAITAGITAYFYIFLFMTIVATLGVYFLVLLFSRNWGDLRRTVFTGIVAIGVVLPHVVYVSFLASQEFYAETLARISLSYSHWPQIEAYYYGRWIILVLLLVYLLRRYRPESVHAVTYFFVMVTGAGLLIAMVSNIFTGRDFEIAVHVARFGIMWYLAVGSIMVMPVYTFVFRPPASDFGRAGTHGDSLKRALIALLFSLLLFQMIANLNRSIPHFSQMREKFVEVQTYSGVLDWLKHQPEGVVLAPNDLNSYIPTLTKQYVLYHSSGAQFLASDDEIRERYLLYRALDHLAEEEFIDPSSSYPFGHAPEGLAKTSALRHRLCTLFLTEEGCPSAKFEEAFIDIAAMRKKFATHYPDLVPNIEREYARYHVRYIVSRVGEPNPVTGTSYCPTHYRDEWFVAFTFTLQQ